MKILKLPFLCFLLTFLFAGCANFKSVAGKLLTSTAQGAEATTLGWLAYVKAGGTTTNQENQVRAAYARYQAAMALATNAYTAAIVSGDQGPYQAASAALSASSASLQQLISTFTSTPKAP